MLPCTWPCRNSMELQGHHGMPAFLQAERCQLIRKNDMNIILGVQFFKTRSHVTVTLGNHLLSLKVLFTSGSTGKPKVVRASHTAVGDPSGQRFCRIQKLTSTCWYLLYHVIPIGWACHQANTANTFDFPVSTMILNGLWPNLDKVMTHLLHVVRHHRLQATDVNASGMGFSWRCWRGKDSWCRGFLLFFCFPNSNVFPNSIFKL